jgi:hypothetical protein
MPLEHTKSCRQINDEIAQEMIRRTIERTGKFLLSASVKPTLGEVQNFGGLPMRVIRHVSFGEALAHAKATSDIWLGDYVDSEDFNFEVVVAD